MASRRVGQDYMFLNNPESGDKEVAHYRMTIDYTSTFGTPDEDVEAVLGIIKRLNFDDVVRRHIEKTQDDQLYPKKTVDASPLRLGREGFTNE